MCHDESMELRICYNIHLNSTLAKNIDTSVPPLSGSLYLCAILSTTYVHDFGIEASVLKPPPQHLSVDVVNGGDARKDQVEHEEVTLQPVGDIVLASARVTHCTDILQVLAYLRLFRKTMTSSSQIT